YLLSLRLSLLPLRRPTRSTLFPYTTLFRSQGKTTLFAGHSGVGKSTLLNLLDPSINQKVGDLSGFSEKGTHTTTFAEMFQLDAGDRKSTRLNSSHVKISYAVFCLKKKTE